MNIYNNGISEFVCNLAENVHGDTDFLIQGISDEYEKRKKKLDFNILIFITA